MKVAVIAFNRPNYLYVMLQSLFLNRGIDDCQVQVYTDGGGDDEVVKVAESFPVSQVYRQKENIGILKNIMFALNNCFQPGIEDDRIMYLEDDFILRPDTLEYAENTPIALQHCFLSLSGGGVYEKADYRPIGNVIERKKFLALQAWVDGGFYIGRPRPKQEGYLFTEKDTGHDGIFSRYLIDNNLMTLFSDKFYVAHFGVCGKNYPSHKLDDKAVELEARMFAGNRKRWLDNIVRIIEREEYPDSHWSDPIHTSILQPRIWPRGFKYE